MKITKAQIKSLDIATLTNVIDWLYDSNWRQNQADKIGRQTKITEIRNSAAADARHHCLCMLHQLLRFANGTTDCADEMDLITCPRCDICGGPAVNNYGDNYTIVCCNCQKQYHAGAAAADYINNHK